jgi:hypothetical protein
MIDALHAVPGHFPAMNPFTRHPHQQGISYAEHWLFAMGIAYRLLKSVTAFAVHALFPFVSISRELDLESTAEFITECNQWIESAGMRGCRDQKSGAGVQSGAASTEGVPVETGSFDDRWFA